MNDQPTMKDHPTDPEEFESARTMVVQVGDGPLRVFKLDGDQIRESDVPPCFVPGPRVVGALQAARSFATATGSIGCTNDGGQGVTARWIRSDYFVKPNLTGEQAEIATVIEDMIDVLADHVPATTVHHAVEDVRLAVRTLKRELPSLVTHDNPRKDS